MDSAQSPESPARPRVLFSERSQLMRRAAERILGDDFEVILAGNSTEAWIVLMEDPLIQVVFHDVADHDNPSDLSLLERIRSSENRRVRETPVVIIMDDDQTEATRARALQQGASDFIDKPFRPSELLARARAHATTSEAVRRLLLLRTQHNEDEATRLGNRRYYFERLAQALSYAGRRNEALSLVHIHLDGLSQKLEQMELTDRGRRLFALGQMLSAAVRREDTVYRTGPETFSFILPGTDASGAEAVRCRLAPELDAMGALDGGGELDLRARFVVQSADMAPGEALVDALRRLRGAMGISVARRQDREEPFSAPVSEIDQLLQMARDGDTDRVMKALPELLERLKPLLKLADQLSRNKLEDSASSSRSG